MSGRVIVVADWDIDGAVSAAQIVYSQEIVGRYPLSGRRNVYLIPSTSRSLMQVIEEISGLNASHLVMLDIAYNRYTESFLERIKRLHVYTIYIDHHISSYIRSSTVEKLVDEFIVGSTPTAYLVFQLINSLGIAPTTRIRAFVEAASAIEGRRLDNVNSKLIQLVTSIARTLSHSRSREQWEKLVRWLSSPLPLTSAQFTIDVSRFVEPPQEEEVHAFASELALRAERIFNIRLIDARRERIVYRPSALASALYRVFRNPVAILLTNKDGKNYVVIKSRDLTAYRLALELYKGGLATDVMGHQTLTYCLLKENVDVSSVKNLIRSAILKKP